jgi:hypothetical protein
LSIELLEGRCVPTTITATTFADGGLGSGSLRDAVLQLNADSGSGDDTIQLLAGTYTLTIQNPAGVHETAGLTGDLNLTQASHRWIIQGAGSSGGNATIVDASQLQDRVFQVVHPGTQVVFQHLVLQGGLAQDNGADGAVAGQSDALGGGLVNNGGQVTLNDVVVQNNKAQGGDAAQLSAPGHNARGGGLYSTGGALTLAGATLATNQVLGGQGSGDSHHVGGNGGDGLGGGLYATGGSLDLSNSLIARNQATGGRGGDGFATFDGYTTHFYGGTGGAAQGGGLYVNGGSLTLATSTLATNQATAGAAGLDGNSSGVGQGGGLYNAGTLTVSNSTLSGNSASGIYSLFGAGGGIFNFATLMVSNSTLSGNSASGLGGGIDNDHGTLTVSNSTLSGNSAINGGGILNGGTLAVSNSALSGNTADLFGGGIDNGGTLTVSNSTLSGNTATSTLSGDGGAIANGATLTVSNCTLSGNTAANGAGIYNNFNGSTLTVSNSTLSGNSAIFGGGIAALAPGTGTVTLTNVTLTDNRVLPAGGVNGQGGGLFVWFISPPPVLHNTLIAGNFHGATGTTPDDVSGHLDPGGDNNLIGDGTGMTGLQSGVHGNQVGTADHPIDPGLGPLADNGGPTLTHALLPGSPAIDAGNNAYATDFDQRGPGFPRIVNGIIDIGAFEFQGAGAGPSPSGSGRGPEARLAELVAGLPPAVSHPVAEPPVLSPGQGSTIAGEGPFVAPSEAAPGLQVAAVDSYLATAFEDRGEQTTVPWSDREPAAIGWWPVWAPQGAAVGGPGL